MDPKPAVCTVMELKNRNRICDDFNRTTGQKPDLELCKSRYSNAYLGQLILARVT